jgi:CxxC motif-containing protein (DUF1111 family)
VVGGSGARNETRFGKTTAGTFDPLVNEGGSLLQTQSIGGQFDSCFFITEVVPADANTVAGRRTTPLFGLGLVDAVPDQSFKDQAAAEKSADPTAAGRVAIVTDPSTNQLRVGKFGWKDQVNSIFIFSGDAYLNEMGITNPVFPTENCPQGDPNNCPALDPRRGGCNPVADPEDNGADVAAFTNFITFLGPPPSIKITGQANAGQQHFKKIGCDTCHQPDMTTGTNSVAALNKVTFHPYSDFLLHDMGSLGDGIVQGAAGAREMRTAPLWGVSAQLTLLHDGRTSDLTTAILAHDGQGKAARDRFNQLNPQQKAQVIAFLQAL